MYDFRSHEYRAALVQAQVPEVVFSEDIDLAVDYVALALQGTRTRGRKEFRRQKAPAFLTR